jgi:spore coat protein U-like protein
MVRRHIISLVAALGLGTVAVKAQLSGSITIEGTVPASTSITVTPVAGYNSLAIETGVSDQGVASVLEKSNWPKGYTVTLESANAVAETPTQAFLKGANVGNADTVPYSIKYEDVPVTLAAGKATVTPNGTKTGPTGVTKSLKVSFAAKPMIEADTYKDTLTLTIATKP